MVNIVDVTGGRRSHSGSYPQQQQRLPVGAHIGIGGQGDDKEFLALMQMLIQQQMMEAQANRQHEQFLRTHEGNQRRDDIQAILQSIPILINAEAAAREKKVYDKINTQRQGEFEYAQAVEAENKKQKVIDQNFAGHQASLGRLSEDLLSYLDDAEEAVNGFNDFSDQARAYSRASDSLEPLLKLFSTPKLTAEDWEHINKAREGGGSKAAHAKHDEIISKKLQESGLERLVASDSFTVRQLQHLRDSIEADEPSGISGFFSDWADGLSHPIQILSGDWSKSRNERNALIVNIDELIRLRKKFSPATPEKRRQLMTAPESADKKNAIEKIRKALVHDLKEKDTNKPPVTEVMAGQLRQIVAPESAKSLKPSKVKTPSTPMSADVDSSYPDMSGDVVYL